MASRVRNCIIISVAGLIGFGVGSCSIHARYARATQVDFPFLAEYAPLPHHVPKYQDGLSLRFAMVHDVLVERFPRHGKVHYEERNRLTRRKLESLAPDDPARFPLADDLAAGLERLGKPAEAVEVMRDKLVRQKAKGIRGRELYTTYANLGTFMAHASFPKAVRGDMAARDEFREGIDFVRKSVEVNPEAHFGREQWQVVLGEFMLAALDKPKILEEFDFLGNRLDAPIDRLLSRPLYRHFGRPYDFEFLEGAAFRHSAHEIDDPRRWAETNELRRRIMTVGAEDGWKAQPIKSHQECVAFDEPVLGIIGMWRQGGGASPHFCLALGETMLRVGQRPIAWEAFERASRLASRFWPDRQLQLFLLEHCRKRQEQIESTYITRPEWLSSEESWEPSPDIPAKFRAQFDSELAYGEGFQCDYQQFEAGKIAAGVPIDDEHMFDEFLAGRKPIASPVGMEEWYYGVPRAKMSDFVASRARAWGLFVAGVVGMLAAIWLRWRGRSRDVEGHLQPISDASGFGHK